jgi:ABC-type glycerol-3-phosphate transport system permease component
MARRRGWSLAGSRYDHRRVGSGARRPSASQLAIHVVLVVTAIVFLMPFYLMITATLRPEGEFLSTTVDLIPSRISLDVYTDLLSDGTITIPRWAFNSLLIAGASTFLNVSLSTLAAYALARLRPPGTPLIIGLIVATLMAPGEVVLIGLFFVNHSLGLLNSLLGVSLSLSVYAVVFLILYNYMRGLPLEIEEAAQLDGASTLQLLRYVVVPLVRPALGAAAILQFLASWQAFTIPLILINRNDLYPLPVAILFQQTDLYSTQQQVLALAVLLSVPTLIVFILTQRRVFAGITVGSGK